MWDSDLDELGVDSRLDGLTDGRRCACYKGVWFLACAAGFACIGAASGNHWWHKHKVAGDIASLEELFVTQSPKKGEGALTFPLHFEGRFGVCPPGFTCWGQAKVCVHPAKSDSCFHPGIENLQGRQYFDVGHDFIKAHAMSQVFYLPSGIQEIQLLYSGGAYEKSGFFLHTLDAGKVICRIASDRKTNAFSQERCEGLKKYEGEPVFICIVDAQLSHWGKVLIDNVRLVDQFSKDLNHAGLVELSPTTKPSCEDLHSESLVDSHSPHMRFLWPGSFR